MEIQGPFTIAISDNKETGLRELHLGFKPAFKQLNLQNRIIQLNEFLVSLQNDLSAATDEAIHQGMLTMVQITQELLPHLQADEIPLDETIIVETGPVKTSPFDDLLRGATL